MFLKLTNAAQEHKNKEIIIHSRYIVSVFPFTPEGSDTETTIVYSALKDSWSVKETPEQIYAMLEMLDQE